VRGVALGNPVAHALLGYNNNEHFARRGPFSASPERQLPRASRLTVRLILSALALSVYHDTALANG